MLRMKDYICKKCGQTSMDVVQVVGEEAIPECCEKPMAQIISAPAVQYKPHYSHALGRKVETYKEEERALESKGQWIATAKEASRVYDTEMHSDVAIKKVTLPQIRKHVEKTAQKLVADGVLTLND